MTTDTASIPALLTEEQLLAAQKLRYADILTSSRDSLEAFLANVVIDCRPEPAPWASVVEDWQLDLLRPLTPAIEKMAGVRKEYNGPRNFYYVLPKGHDKTGLIGRICSWACAFSRHRIEARAAAVDTEQAGQLLQSINAERLLNPWLADLIKPTNYSVRGPGGHLKILSSDAPSSGGQKNDLIVVDELTWWPKRDLYNMLFLGREKRPDCVFIIITNAGMLGSWQHEVLEMARSRPESWYVHETPEYETLASWMTLAKIDEMRAGVPHGIAKRLLDNVWVDATETPLLTPELMAPCEDSGYLWTEYHRHFGYKAELYHGVDIGITNDRTCMWTLELEDGLAVTRDVWVPEQGMPLAEQKRHIKHRLTRSSVKCNIDVGAQGYQIARELEAEHPGIVEAVALSSGRQGQIASIVKAYFEAQKIRIPADKIIRRDFQQISKVEVGPAGTPKIKTEKGSHGHGDRFWACGLALSGLPIELGPRYHRAPKGIRSRFAGAA